MFIIELTTIEKYMCAFDPLQMSPKKYVIGQKRKYGIKSSRVPYDRNRLKSLNHVGYMKLIYIIIIIVIYILQYKRMLFVVTA